MGIKLCSVSKKEPQQSEQGFKRFFMQIGAKIKIDRAK